MSTFDDNFPAKGNPKMSDRVFGFDSESLKNAGMTNQALYDLFKGNLEGEFPTSASLLPAFDLDNIRVMTNTAPDGKLVKSNVLNPLTGETITFKETDLFIDGTSMDDEKVTRSLGIYAKSGSKYFVNSEFLSKRLITAKMFGAKEDADLSGGGSDDSTAIVNGLRAANELGATFQLSPGRTYKMVGNHVINRNNKGSFTFDLNGATIYQQSSSLRFYNSDTEVPTPFLTTTVTADVFRGKTFVTVAAVTGSTLGVQSGDLMMIESPASSGNGETVCQCYMVSFIDTTTTNKIYIENLIVNDITAQQITDSGTTGSITAKFIRLANGLRITNGRIVSNKGAQYQVLVTGQNNFRCDEVEFNNARRFALAINYCGNYFVNNSQSYKHGYATKDDGYVNKPDSPDGESFGYGFLSTRTAYGRYNNCYSGDGWHSFDVGIGATITEYNDCTTTKDAYGFSSHGGSWITRYNNCNSYGGYGVTVRSAFLYINGGNIKPSVGHAISTSSGITEMVINNGDLDMSNVTNQSYIYSLHQDTPAGNLSVGYPSLRILKGNTIRNCSSISYFEKNDARTVVAGNTITNCADLRVSGNITLIRGNESIILNGSAQSTFRVRVTNIQRLVIKNNILNNGTTYVGSGSAFVFLTGSTPASDYRIKILNNESDDTSNLVRIDSVTNLRIALIKGNSYRRGICQGAATNTILHAENNYSLTHDPNLPFESPTMPVPLNYFPTSGTTGGRPVNTTINGINKIIPNGFEYFDTTLGKPVWWNVNTWAEYKGDKPVQNRGGAGTHTIAVRSSWEPVFNNLTSPEGVATVVTGEFLTSDQIDGVVTGGAKTFVGDGVTLRIPTVSSNVVNQYQRFSLKFLSPTEAVLSVF